MHLLAIRPPFLYCKLFCRQDGGIVTPPSLRPSTKNNTLLVERAKVWRGMSKCGRLGRCVLAATLFDRYRASLHVYERSVRVRPPAPKKAGLCLFVIVEVWQGGVVEMRSLGSLHRAATLCDRHRASLHDPHSASSPPSTKKQGYACL